MYHCTLSFYINIDNQDLVNSIKAFKPLQKFTHIFHNFTIPTYELANADIIICSPVSKDNLINIIGQRGMNSRIIVLCNKELSNSFVTYLGTNDEVWPIDIGDNEFRFYFSKMLYSIKAEKDAWLSNNYLNTLINSIPDLIWYKDKNGAHLKVNNSFCKAVNKSADQIEGRGHYYIWDIEPDEYANGEYICMESEFEVMEKKKTCVFDEKVKIGDEMRELKTYKSPLFDFDGSVMGTVGIAKDVTLEIKYRHRMVDNANKDFLTGLYNRRYIYNYMEQIKGTPFTIYYIDIDNFKSINDMYGHAEGDRALITTKNVLCNCMKESMIARLGGDEFLIVSPGKASKSEIEYNANMIATTINNTYQSESNFSMCSVSVGTFYVSDSSTISIDTIIKQADERMYQIKRMHHDTGNGKSNGNLSKDTLTGLDCYEEFLDKLTSEIEHIGNRRLAVIYSDIKHFKYINDTYGYQKGNEVLASYCKKVRSLSCNIICASRIFSDNIIGLMELDSNMSEESFKKFIDDSGKNIERELNTECCTNKLRFVSGAYILTADSKCEAETAVSNANLARKEAKSLRDVRVLLFNNSMTETIKREMEISSSLADAIKNKEIIAFYQPKIDTETLEVIGAEALARWQKKDGSFIYPDDFIPILEKTGQIVDVDYYIYREVFAFLRDSLDHGRKIVPISMNVSRVHLQNTDFIKYIKCLFDEYKIPAEYIEFELTESIYIRNTEEAIALVNGLHEMGVKVSMDDFGTGYSSLNMLGVLPIDTLKLDKAFLNRSSFSNNDKIIISGVINMSKQLQMTSLCEGVENEEQISYLKEVGCDVQQGFYFSKPVPQNTFSVFIEKGKIL